MSNFYIDSFIGKGGSSLVFKAKVMKDEEELYINQDVVVKLCDSPLITGEFCISSFLNEYTNINLFSYLNKNNICYNYPLVYGYFHECLFFSFSQIEEIISYVLLEENKEKIGESKDAFIIYCLARDKTKLPNSLLSFIKHNIQPEFLFKSDQKLPKCNINGLLGISLRSNVDENKENKDNEEIWEGLNELYDYILTEKEVGCSIFLLLQYIEGNSLNKFVNFYFSDVLFFEYMYSIFCSISTLKNIQGDIHDDNVMISPNKTELLRIYSYRNKYYIVDDSFLFYWIDFNVIVEKHDKNLIKSDFTKLFSHCTPSQKDFINNFFSEKEEEKNKKFLEKLFEFSFSGKRKYDEKSLYSHIVGKNHRIFIVES